MHIHNSIPYNDSTGKIEGWGKADSKCLGFPDAAMKHTAWSWIEHTPNGGSIYWKAINHQNYSEVWELIDKMIEDNERITMHMSRMRVITRFHSVFPWASSWEASKESPGKHCQDFHHKGNHNKQWQGMRNYVTQQWLKSSYTVNQKH